MCFQLSHMFVDHLCGTHKLSRRMCQLSFTQVLSISFVEPTNGDGNGVVVIFIEHILVNLFVSLTNKDG